MTLRHLFLVTSIGGAFSLGCAMNSEPASELFASMIMTKQQQASSTPTDSGVLLHDPDSDSWNRIGPKIMIIPSAIADPSDPDTIFFAAGNGIARTRDRGKTWKLVTGWRESDIQQLAIDPEDGSRIYAATAWGVTISSDGGDTWQSRNSGLDEYMSRGIIIDENKTRRLLLATTSGLFESTNRAKSWKRVKTFPEVAVMRLRRSRSNPDLWIAGTEGQGVWISRDNCKTWKQSAPAIAEANVYAVAIDPFNELNLVAGGWNTGVYYSTDSGYSWSVVSPSFPSKNITAAVFDENIPHRVWISTFEEGTFYSDDAGSSWSEPQLYGAYVYDLGFLPVSCK